MTAPTTSYHLRPDRGWLNDPNGMTLVDGVWHVFFQHNPDAPVHGQIAWGHATSTDLALWRLRPVAFSPTPGGPDAFGCWSGSYVPGHERPAVAYSGIADESGRSTVCLRWGSPDLIDWGAPVVVAETPDVDDIKIMRDPFVFEYEGRELAVLGAGLSDGSPAVILFDRSDELAWRYLGVLVADDPVLRGKGKADIWECPQLFPVEDRWVLVVSLHDDGVLGNVVAAVGDLVEDGEGLRFVAETADLLDNGTDFYAPQVTLADGEPLLIGWIRQEGQDPQVRDHAGCLTLPRRLQLVDGVVASRLDRLANGVLVGSPVPLEAGETVLQDRRWRVIVVRPGVRITHPSLGEVELAPSSRLWVDGAVVELYRPSGISATWRHDEPWTLVVPEAGAVEVAKVVPWVP